MKVLVPETVPPTAHEWEGPIGGQDGWQACLPDGMTGKGRDEDEVRGFRN